jgi:hypothetical protein
MKTLKLSLAAIALLAISAASAFAQTSCPAFSYGKVLTAGQWQACFDAKQNALGYTPVNKAGDFMLGPLTMAASTATIAGVNLPQGTAPSSPVNGDLWTTSSGLYVRIAGTTIGPLSGATSSSFAATSPLAVTFPAGVVTYAFDFTVANSFLATQTFRTILAGTTNTYDIGTNASTAAFRTIYAGTSFVGPVGTFTTSVAAGGCTIGSNAICATGTIAASGDISSSGGDIFVPAAQAFYWSTRSVLTSPSDGVITLSNNATTGFTRLQLGGTTSSFPAIKRNAAALNFRLADDSADAAVTAGAGTFTSSSASALAAGPNGATNPTLQVDASTLSAATGLKIKGAAAAGGLALSVVTSGTNENLAIDAAGSGTITLGGTSTGAIVHTRATTLSAALTYGGVTLSNSVVGTGSMVLGTAPSISALTVTGSFTATGLVTNADLANPSVTVNTTTCTLGSSCTITATATSITVGTTTVTGGTTTRILYNNAGTLGEYTITGSGTVVAMQTSPSFTTPTLGAALFTSLAGPVIGPQSNSTTAVKITKADLSTAVMTFDTTNARVGINKTPGAFDLDVNGAVNFGSTASGTIFDASTGFRVSGAATSGNYLRGNGTNFVSAAIAAADLPLGSSSAFGAVKVDNTTITASGGVITAVGAAATSISVGTTTISSGTSTRLLYDNAGVLGEQTIASALGARTTTPTVQIFTSGTNATYTTPANVLWIDVMLVGGGGGGAGGGSAVVDGSAGGSTCWKTSGTACSSPDSSAAPGSAGTTQASTGGGTSGTCTVMSAAGAAGGAAIQTPGVSAAATSANGGASSIGGAGGGAYQANTGNAGTTGGGGGGGGAGGTAGNFGGGGGGGGGTCRRIISSPAATYVYTVGAAGSAGSAGTGGAAGGAGGAGYIVVVEHYGS